MLRETHRIKKIKPRILPPTFQASDIRQILTGWILGFALGPIVCYSESLKRFCLYMSIIKFHNAAQKKIRGVFGIHAHVLG